tara:strand:+ start:284 stop:472 length:189 start_codon:yes stop_codon:yes gene_type:complete
LIRRSSAVEQLTVNQLVVGSIPTAGANSLKINDFLGSDWQNWNKKWILEYSNIFQFFTHPTH